MPVTEIGCHPLRDGVADVMDDATKEGKILSDAWRAVTSEETGPYCVYWGVEVENPATFWAFFDFDSVEHHEKFARERGSSIVKDMDQVLQRGGYTKHFEPRPSPPSALRAPVTEIMMAFFAPDISEAAKAAARERVEQFSDKALSRCADVQAVNVGWGVEDDFPMRGTGEERKGTVLFALIGWPSIDTHMQFRDTEAFKESVGLLRDMEGMVKLTMFHVKCKSMANQTRRA